MDSGSSNVALDIGRALKRISRILVAILVFVTKITSLLPRTNGLALRVLSAASGLIFVNGFSNGDLVAHWHHVCERLSFRRRDAIDAGRVLNSHLALHGHVRGKATNAVTPILGNHVVNKLALTSVLDVDVNIGHGDSGRVEEPLKVEVMGDWVNVCNVETVRNDGACSGTSARPKADVVVAAPVHCIPENQEVPVEAHLVDNAKLVVKGIKGFVVSLTTVQERQSLHAQCSKHLPF